MPHHLGQGACLAFEDAATLQALTPGGGPRRGAAGRRSESYKPAAAAPGPPRSSGRPAGCRRSCRPVAGSRCGPGTPRSTRSTPRLLGSAANVRGAVAAAVLTRPRPPARTPSDRPKFGHIPCSGKFGGPRRTGPAPTRTERLSRSTHGEGKTTRERGKGPPVRRVPDQQSTAVRATAPHCDVRLLGPVELLGGERPVAALTAGARRLLGLLALRANHPVAAAQLADPAGAGLLDSGPAGSLEEQMAELASAFDACGLPGAVTVRRGGRLLRLPGRLIDARRFDQLLLRARARMAVGDLDGRPAGSPPPCGCGRRPTNRSP